MHEDFIYLLVVLAARAAWFVLGLGAAVGLGIGIVRLVRYVQGRG